MKTTIILSFLLLTICILSAAKPVKKSKLIGTWNRVNTEAKDNPTLRNINRTMTFDSKNNFDGRIFNSHESRLYNHGMYFLPDDTTLIILFTKI